MLGRGFTLVSTPSFFDADLLSRLKRSRTVLTPDCPRWWKFPQFAHYACWLERLLEKALPDEPVGLASLEYRHERAGLVDDEVDGLHADGGYLRSVYTHFGLSTLYRDGGVERPVPDGQTLLMTAQDRTRVRRVRCTLHRRPGTGPERAVIVGSFTPRGEQAEAVRVYRQVVQAEGLRGWRARLMSCPLRVGDAVLSSSTRAIPKSISFTIGPFATMRPDIVERIASCAR
jgi:hypothetical protein